MASIFTYDPDPPRVSSPWLAPEQPVTSERASSVQGQPQPGLLSDYGVTRLQAEPQEGPTEYKLHLLLRPRRAYRSMTTDSQSTGRRQRKRESSVANQAKGITAVTQSRQERLQHLTTQLLWRMQQSSPYHATSSKELVIPRLAKDNVDVSSDMPPQALASGLEESRGALYEIGVSDNGTLVGLTKDEMDESISTLKAMASSLGCSVEILRMVVVGECEWIEKAAQLDNASDSSDHTIQTGKLWVAEALVMPNVTGRASTGIDSGLGEPSLISNTDSHRSTTESPKIGSSSTPQLRVTFTGPTTSGKSSLLGTLSTGTRDNGRGKSRLSLLKHRHEVVSGVTSSIAQELLGYKDQGIINFSQANIDSWTDIHDCSEGGRLIFVSDSGGHPRYRRTVLRGLMNWAPNWSILCVAADDDDSRSSDLGAPIGDTETVDSTAAGVDLANAHLAFSLKLEVPLAIVITKLDLASKASLQKTMSRVLTAVKQVKRVPKILQPDSVQHEQLKVLPVDDVAKVSTMVESISAAGSLTRIVPIVLTSAVKGTGIGLVHALLAALPLPPAPTSRDFVGPALNPEQPKCLFHIDDTFNLPASYAAISGSGSEFGDVGLVVSGHLRFGSMSVGEKIVVGPFPAEDEEFRRLAPDDRPSPGSCGLSMSHPSSSIELARIAMKNAISASAIAGEWHDAHIVSVRNLRLPVRTLEAGQAGSVGLVFDCIRPTTPLGNGEDFAPRKQVPRIRRGMVLAIPSKHMEDTGLSLQAASGFTATFSDPAAESLVIGSYVNVYVASVRAAARVLAISRHNFGRQQDTTATEDIEDIFSLNEDLDNGKDTSPDETAAGREVSLELLHNREWIELGSRVILLEGSSQDKSGLEGIVGKVIEIVD